jgi:hypothetical protein
LTLSDEIAALDGARRALDANQAREALALLDRHDRDFSPAALDVEASVLRIQALAALGRTGEARSLASSFLLAHPDLPQARRVKTLMSNIDTPSSNP